MPLLFAGSAYDPVLLGPDGSMPKGPGATCCRGPLYPFPVQLFLPYRDRVTERQHADRGRAASVLPSRRSRRRDVVAAAVSRAAAAARAR